MHERPAEVQRQHCCGTPFREKLLTTNKLTGLKQKLLTSSAQVAQGNDSNNAGLRWHGQRLSSTCRAGDDGTEAVLALDVVQDIEHAHAHPVLAAAVLVAFQLHPQAACQIMHVSCMNILAHAHARAVLAAAVLVTLQLHARMIAQSMYVKDVQSASMVALAAAVMLGFSCTLNKRPCKAQ